MLDDRCALYLIHEAAPEYPLDRPPRMIGSEREQKRREDAVPTEKLDQPGDTFACSAKRIDVDFKGKPRSHRIDRR